MTTSWILLALAGALEVAWLVSLKLSDGLTRPGPTAAMVLLTVLSISILGVAARELPAGTAYAVWTGIGAAGGAVAGIVLFGEPTSGWRLASLALVVAGIVGLKLSSPLE